MLERYESYNSIKTKRYESCFREQNVIRGPTVLVKWLKLVPLKLSNAQASPGDAVGTASSSGGLSGARGSAFQVMSASERTIFRVAGHR